MKKWNWGACLCGVIAGAVLLMMAVAIVIRAMGRAEEKADNGDERRRMDVALVMEAMTVYQVEHNGRLPENVADFEGYAKERITPYADPDGMAYTMIISKMYDDGIKTLPKMDHTFYVMTSARCDGDRVVYSEQMRNYAILYRLSNTTYCVDNW